MIITALETDTTGKPHGKTIDDPDYPRMMRIAAMTWDSDGAEIGYISNLVRQDKRASKSAEKIHGITDRRAGSLGIPEQIPVGWITNMLKVSTHVVGWSLNFDLDIIRAALIRYGRRPDELIRSGLIKINLKESMTPIVGKTGDDGAQVWPELTEGYENLFGKPLYEPGEKRDARRDVTAARDIFLELKSRNLLSNLSQEAA